MGKNGAGKSTLLKKLLQSKVNQLVAGISLPKRKAVITLAFIGK
jgi:ABC-type cobalamin/Fe3+-siderophores transport system ATPase subunit